LPLIVIVVDFIAIVIIGSVVEAARVGGGDDDDTIVRSLLFNFDVVNAITDTVGDRGNDRKLIKAAATTTEVVIFVIVDVRRCPLDILFFFCVGSMRFLVKDKAEDTVVRKNGKIQYSINLYSRTPPSSLAKTLLL